MAPESCITCRSPCVNILIDLVEELDELIGAQGQVRGFNVGSNEALTSPEAFTPPLVLPISENFFTKFIKVFIETTQARNQLEPWERLLKARTPEIYSEKSHMDCYHFCQQCEDYFKTSGATGMNCTSCAATFFHGSISFRWAQHKRRHKCAALSCGQSSRPSSGKISGVPWSSLTVSGVSLGGTPNTSWKKPEIGYSTFNTSNLSYQSLILFGSLIN